MFAEPKPRWSQLVPMLAALSAALLAASGCGPGDAPKVPTASDGLVFVRSEGGRSDVLRARLSDGAVRTFLETPEVDEARPLWISSALRVAVNVRPADDADAPPRLDLVELETGRKHSATGELGSHETQASVSPDGKRIAFVFGAPEGGRPGRGIKILQPLSGRTETLAAAPARTLFLAPVIGRDGYPVVVQARGPQRGDDLWLLDRRQGSALVQSLGLHDTDPRFARDGRSVFFTRAAFVPPAQRAKQSETVPRFGGGDVCQVEIDTRAVRCVIESEDADEFAADPSPTRDEIVFVRKRDGATDLFLASVAPQGTGATEAQAEPERRLTDSPDRIEWGPHFSPDGERIVFMAGSAELPSVGVVDREGRVLFEAPGHSPDWAPPFP